MARATDLPIYRVAYELLLLVTRLTQSYPRGYRQGLARDICAEAQAVVGNIFRANCTTDKAGIIEQLRERLSTLQLMLRVSFDLRLISPRQFGATVELTDAVGKQAAGWLKFARKSA
jgi:hypothetical protein